MGLGEVKNSLGEGSGSAGWREVARRRSEWSLRVTWNVLSLRAELDSPPETKPEAHGTWEGECPPPCTPRSGCPLKAKHWGERQHFQRAGHKLTSGGRSVCGVEAGRPSERVGPDIGVEGST